jgi:hypothetical protein
MKKRQPLKTQKDSFERPPMKKEQPQKNAKGLVQKTSDEKGGNPQKMQRGSFKRPLMKKR